MHMTTETPTLPDPRTATAEAVHARQGLVERLVPVDERPTLRTHLHEAAQALKLAFDGGVSSACLWKSSLVIERPAPPSLVASCSQWLARRTP
jgi:hypothetical protein